MLRKSCIRIRIWIQLDSYITVFAVLDPDPDQSIVKVLDSEPYLEYTDPQHCNFPHFTTAD